MRHLSPLEIRRIIFMALISALVILMVSACVREQTPEPTPFSTNTPKPSATITATFTPQPSATPTETPTPAPLTPAGVFDLVSPSVVFIDTPVWRGSGVVIADGYLVTNAHVVWPYDKVRVVLPDGREFLDLPVLGWDLLADLAVLGPLDDPPNGLELVDGEDLVIGSEVYLVGYPGETDEFPQPTITGGLISRLREWEPLEVTYFQTDAPIAGGQSGGVLVSEDGDVIGISGFSFTEADFGLVASGVDVQPRINALLAGEAPAEIGPRRLVQENGRNSHKFYLRDPHEGFLFFVFEPPGTNISVELSGLGDGAFVVSDVYGGYPIWADDTISGEESGEFIIDLEAPYFINVFQYSLANTNYQLRSGINLYAYDDPDDGRKAVINSEAMFGSLDFPGDQDTFELELSRGQQVNILVDSILIDPYFSINYAGAQYDEILFDDDSGEGMFGLNAELTYEAPADGTYFLTVEDTYAIQVGGYILTVSDPATGDPTPVAPPPTATPVSTEFGSMVLYEDRYYGYALPYPAGWENRLLRPNPPVFCQFASACFADPDIRLSDFSIVGPDLLAITIFAVEEADMVADAETYGLMLETMALEREVFVTEETITTTQGLTATATFVTGDGMGLAQLLHLGEGDYGFLAIFMVGLDESGDLPGYIRHAFEHFQVTEGVD